jgi:hypothetical protein
VHPYRKPHPGAAATPAASEELVLYAALCVIGAIPIVAALVRGEPLGVEATLGGLMALGGAAGVRARWLASS